MQDDDDLVRLTLNDVLQQQGFDVTAAASVPEVLKHTSSNDYEVLLSDLHMLGTGDDLPILAVLRASVTCSMRYFGNGWSTKSDVGRFPVRFMQNRRVTHPEWQRFQARFPPKSFRQLRLPAIGWRSTHETGGERTLQRHSAGGGIALHWLAALQCSHNLNKRFS